MHSYEDGDDMVEEHLAVWSEVEGRRVRIEEDRLVRTKMVAKPVEEDQFHRQNHEPKRLSLQQRHINLEVKRAAFEWEERHSLMNERKGMLALIVAFALKLN